MRCQDDVVRIRCESCYIQQDTQHRVHERLRSAVAIVTFCRHPAEWQPREEEMMKLETVTSNHHFKARLCLNCKRIY